MHVFPQESRPDLHTNEPTLLKVKRIDLTIFFVYCSLTFSGMKSQFQKQLKCA